MSNGTDDFTDPSCLYIYSTFFFVSSQLTEKILLTKYKTTALQSSFPDCHSNIFQRGKSVDKTWITATSKQAEETVAIPCTLGLHFTEIGIQFVVWGSWWGWRGWGIRAWGWTSTKIPNKEANDEENNYADCLHCSAEIRNKSCRLH